MKTVLEICHREAEPTFLEVSSLNVCSSEKQHSRHLLRKAILDVIGILGVAVLPAIAFYELTPSIPQMRAESPANAADENVLWIDARSEDEFAKDHIPGALSLNEKNWQSALPRLFDIWQPPRPIVVYCSAGCTASAKIASKLTEQGFDFVRVMEGGLEEWKRSNRSSGVHVRKMPFSSEQ